MTDVTVQDYSYRWLCSPRTVRHWLITGTLKGKKLGTGKTCRWLIDWSQPPPEPPTSDDYFGAARRWLHAVRLWHGTDPIYDGDGENEVNIPSA